MIRRIAILLTATLAIGSIGCEPSFDSPLAEAQFRLNRAEWNLAAEASERAVAANGNSAEAFLARGRARLALGKIDEAIADLTEANRLSPRDPESLYHRAIAYRQKGDAESADADSFRAREIDVKYRMAFGSVHDVAPIDAVDESANRKTNNGANRGNDDSSDSDVGDGIRSLFAAERSRNDDEYPSGELPSSQMPPDLNELDSLSSAAPMRTARDDRSLAPPLRSADAAAPNGFDNSQPSLLPSPDRTPGARNGEQALLPTRPASGIAPGWRPGMAPPRIDLIPNAAPDDQRRSTVQPGATQPPRGPAPCPVTPSGQTDSIFVPHGQSTFGVTPLLPVPAPSLNVAPDRTNSFRPMR